MLDLFVEPIINKLIACQEGTTNNATKEKLNERSTVDRTISKQSCQQSGQYKSLRAHGLEQTQPTDHPPSWRFIRTTKRRLRSHQAYQLREELDQLGARSFCSTLFMFIPHLCQALLTPPKPVKPLPTTRLLRQRPCPCPAAD